MLPSLLFVRSFIYNRIIPPESGSRETRWKKREEREIRAREDFFVVRIITRDFSFNCDSRRERAKVGPSTSIGIDGSRRIFSKDHGLCSLGDEENVPYKETWHLRKRSREIPTFLRLLGRRNVNSQDLIKRPSRFDWLIDESRLKTSRTVCL